MKLIEKSNSRACRIENWFIQTVPRAKFPCLRGTKTHDYIEKFDWISQEISHAQFLPYKGIFRVSRVHLFSLMCAAAQQRVEFPCLISESSLRQIRAIIRRGFMADTSRNNKEYPVSLPFLSNKSRRSTAAFT